MGRSSEQTDRPILFDSLLLRTFASQLIAAGVSPHLVKDWMGHASIQTTERSYIASRPVSLEIGRM